MQRPMSNQDGHLSQDIRMSIEEGYLVPTGEARIERIVKKSRFIASAGPASTVDAAQAFVSRVRAEMPGANHHVQAYLVGFGNSRIEHCSDAGEPRGTAGFPLLAVWRGSGLGDIVVVVTRYFGGIKLGTGGLVEAYSESAKAVLRELQVVRKVPMLKVQLTLDYTDYQPVLSLSRDHGARVERQDFATSIQLVLTLPASEWLAFSAELAEITAGRAKTVPLDDAGAPTLS